MFSQPNVPIRRIFGGEGFGVTIWRLFFVLSVCLLVLCVMVGCAGLALKQDRQPASDVAKSVPGSQVAQSADEGLDMAAQDEAAQFPLKTQLIEQADQLEGFLLGSDQLFFDPDLKHYLNQLVERLYPDRAGQARLYILNNSGMRAFSLPNGALFLSTGLFSSVQSEAQLAAVLSHVLAHQFLDHVYMRLNRDDPLPLSQVAEDLALPVLEEFSLLWGIVGFTEQDEQRADQLALQRYKAASFPAVEALSVLKIIGAEASTFESPTNHLFSNALMLSRREAWWQRLFQEAGLSLIGQKDKSVDAEFAELIKPLRTTVLIQRLQAEQYDRVIYQLTTPEDVLTVYPDFAAYYLGEALRLRGEPGDIEQAEKIFNDLIVQLPEFAPSYRALGELYFQQSRFLTAKRYFEQYLAADPAAPDRAFIDYYIQRLQGASI